VQSLVRREMKGRYGTYFGDDSGMEHTRIIARLGRTLCSHPSVDFPMARRSGACVGL
jgi:hypothetical protein